MADTTKVHHPIFARMYERMAPAFEAKGAAEHRAELLADLSGRVIEVGAGTGLNFKYYPAKVTEVVAIEPEPHLREIARTTAQDAPVVVTVVDGTADHLPTEDAAFDAGVVSLVLCSVPSQPSALAELFRVIRPGGELRFYEHVLAENPRWATRQHRAAPIWRLFGGGCNPDRETGAAIQAAGFTTLQRRDLLFAPNWIAKFIAPHILGRARRP
jgi:ubiquinone/menaquinone biosynthesis C-methylase UbiE